CGSQACERWHVSPGSPWAERTGRYDLIATVTKDSDADVLAFTVEIPPATQSNATSSGLFGSALALGIKDRISSGDSGAVFAVVVAFILGGIAGVLLARRHRAAGVIVAAVILPLFAFGAFAHEGEDHDASQNTQPAGTQRDRPDARGWLCFHP